VFEQELDSAPSDPSTVHMLLSLGVFICTEVRGVINLVFLSLWKWAWVLVGGVDQRSLPGYATSKKVGYWGAVLGACVCVDLFFLLPHEFTPRCFGACARTMMLQQQRCGAPHMQQELLPVRKWLGGKNPPRSRAGPVGSK